MVTNISIDTIFDKLWNCLTADCRIKVVLYSLFLTNKTVVLPSFKIRHYDLIPFSSTDLFLYVMELLLKFLQVGRGHVPRAIIHEGTSGARHHYARCRWARHDDVTRSIVVVGA